jgi:hypothetical protein
MLASRYRLARPRGLIGFRLRVWRRSGAASDTPASGSAALSVAAGRANEPAARPELMGTGRCWVRDLVGRARLADGRALVPMSGRPLRGENRKLTNRWSRMTYLRGTLTGRVQRDMSL